MTGRMRPLRRLLEWFESFIDPFATVPPSPPPTTVAYLSHFVLQARWAFLAMLVLGGLVALLEAALFWFVGRLVDLLDASAASDGWQGLLSSHGLELGAMLAVVAVIRLVVIGMMAITEEQVIVPGFFNLVRWQNYAQVSRQSLSFFQDDFAGRIATKLWSGGQAAGDFMVSILQVVWFIVVYTFTTLLLIGDLDWRLAALVVVWIAGFALAARYFLPRVRAYARRSAEAGSMVSGRLVDSFSNIETLKLSGREAENDDYIRDGFNQFLAVLKPFTRHLTGVRVTLAALSGLMISAIAALAIDLWLSGTISVGAVAFTMALVLRLNMLLARLMTQLNGLMRNFGTMQNAMELVTRPVKLSDAPDAAEMMPFREEIRFDDVVFHYGKGEGVISGFRQAIKAGERVALVGRSGAGKSTLVRLLLRFFDVEGGAVTLDGVDVRQVSQESLRRNFAVVAQEPGLLNRSIRDNILYGRKDATEADMVAAAKRASAHDFILSLKDAKGRTGYDAHVGERGVKLSGGQRQRIAIARAFLRDAPILILDEATSSLDSEVEAAIQENLFALMEGKTVIAIAHRLSTIAQMDRIVVLDGGTIVESGPHDQLLRQGGLYAALWDRQAGLSARLSLQDGKFGTKAAE